MCRWQISDVLENATEAMRMAGAEMVDLNLSSIVNFGDAQYGGALTGLTYFESPRELSR